MSGSTAATAPTLTDHLRLDPLGPDLFQGRCHAGFPSSAYGGAVAGQALAAASATVTGGLRPHSLHGYFVALTDPSLPVAYQVVRLSDGRSYQSRHVIARQQGRTVFTLTTSYKEPEPAQYQRHAPPPAVADPEDSLDLFARWQQVDPEDWSRAGIRDSLELRRVPLPDRGPTGTTRQRLWIRARDPLGVDPRVHAAALTYASDLLLAPTAALELEQPRMLRDGPSTVFMTSLDHAVWFHRPFLADDWLLFDQQSPTAGDGRGFSQTQVWDRDGRLVATVAQESVLRPHRTPMERRSSP